MLKIAITPEQEFSEVLVKMLADLSAFQQILSGNSEQADDTSLLRIITIISQFDSSYISSLVFPSESDNCNAKMKKFSLLYIIFNKIKSAKLSTTNTLFDVSSEADRVNLLSSVIIPEEKSPQYFDAKTQLTVEQLTQKSDLDLLLMLNAYFLPLKKNSTDSRSVFENFVSEFLVYATMLSSDYIKQDKVAVYQFQEVDAYKYYFLEQIVPIVSEFSRNTLRIINETMKLIEKSGEIVPDKDSDLGVDAVTSHENFVSVQQWLHNDPVFKGLLRSTEANSGKSKLKSADDLFSELEVYAHQAFIGLEFHNNSLINISARQPSVASEELTQFNEVITCLQKTMLELHSVLDRFIKILTGDFVEKFSSVKKARIALSISSEDAGGVTTPRSRLSESGIDQIRQNFISEESQRDSLGDDFFQRHLVALRKKPVVIQKKLPSLVRSKRDALMASASLTK